MFDKAKLEALRAKYAGAKETEVAPAEFRKALSLVFGSSYRRAMPFAGMSTLLGMPYRPEGTDAEVLQWAPLSVLQEPVVEVSHPCEQGLLASEGDVDPHCSKVLLYEGGPAVKRMRVGVAGSGLGCLSWAHSSIAPFCGRSGWIGACSGGAIRLGTVGRSSTLGACRSKGLVAGEHPPDRLGELAMVTAAIAEPRRRP